MILENLGTEALQKLPRGYVGPVTAEEDEGEIRIALLELKQSEAWSEGVHLATADVSAKHADLANDLEPEATASLFRQIALSMCHNGNAYDRGTHPYFAKERQLALELQALRREVQEIRNLRIGPPEFEAMRQLADFDRPETSTEPFKAWFDQSAVVDAAGRPLIVFHGTRRDINEFTTEPTPRKKATNPDWLGMLGSWFAAPSFSESYEEGNAESIAEGFSSMRGIEGAVIYPVYLSLQKAYEFEDYDELCDDCAQAGGAGELRAKLIRAGYDGIVVRESSTDGNLYRSDWVAFYPTQIKSALSNVGTFDPQNPDIRFSVVPELGIAESEVRGMTKDLFDTQETQQPRARSGGEYGPNGEWYAGGAFIATTDLPKKNRQWISKHTNNALVQVDYFGAEEPTKSAPRVGEIPILGVVGGTVLRGPTGPLNEVYLNYLAIGSTADHALIDKLRELAQKFIAGERWVKVVDYPEFAKAEDLVRMILAGEPVPGAALHKFPNNVRENFRKVMEARVNMSSQEMPTPAVKRPNAIAPGKLPSSDLKTRVLDLTWGSKGIKRLDGAGMLAAVVNRTGRPVFVVDGNFGRNEFKAALAEADQAGLEFDKIYVFADSGTYSGRSIDFMRLDSVIPREISASTVELEDVIQQDGDATEAMVDSEAFRAWFGESKVVDAQGAPMVLYHGTDSDFSVFRTNAWEGGAFFSTNKIGAMEYGNNLMSVYLSINNPLEVSSRDWIAGTVLNDEAAKENGYDGYVIRNHDIGSEADQPLVGDTYVAFSPHQIKSADANVGAFNPKNPDIRYSVTEAEQGAAKPLRRLAYSHAEMIARGADGNLARGYERYIPLDSLDGLEPRPANNESDDGEYHPGKQITQPIEVIFDGEAGTFMVYSGNHRIAQARANGQTHILAFVEPDKRFGPDYIGPLALRESPDKALELTNPDVRFSLVEAIDATANTKNAVEGQAGRDTSPASATKILRAEFPTVDFFLMDNSRDIERWTLTGLEVPRDQRKRGIGTAFMERLAELADKNGVILTLSPATAGDGKGTTSRGRLVDFYKRFDFYENKGRRKDFTIRDGMIRKSNHSPVLDKPIVAPTETHNFTKWFGNSKVVDAQGRPLVMYHGTGNSFAVFDTDMGFADDDFIFVTPSADEAIHFADVKASQVEYEDDEEAAGPIVMPVYVFARNPFDYANRDHVSAVVKHASKAWLMRDSGRDIESAIASGDWHAIEDPHIQGAIKELGFDGFYAMERGVKNLAVFSPSQLKSAIGNSGEFDPVKSDIRFSTVDVEQEQGIELSESPEFLRWFGDSKVVDEDGNPLVVYHGTSANFDTFDVQRQGQTAGVGGGLFFTKSKEVASDVYGWRDGGHVMSVYLSLKNPLGFEEYFELTNKDKYEETSGGRDAPVNYFDENSDAILEFAKSSGFDGIMWPADQDSELPHDLIVVFDPAQIKSATNSNGAFNPANPDIRFSVVEGEQDLAIVESPDFRRWFGGSRVVDAHNSPLVVSHLSKKPGITKFKDDYKTELSSMGFHFGTVEQATFRGSQYDFKSSTPELGNYFLSIKNPMRVSHMASYAPDHLAEWLMDLELIEPEAYDRIREEESDDEVSIGSRLAKILRVAGYDGLVYTNEKEGAGDSYVPFDATQIKSATHNNGSFNIKSPDIRFSTVAESQNTESDGVLVDDARNPLVVYHGTTSDFAEFQSAEHGIFFSSDLHSAQAYAMGHDHQSIAESGGRVHAVHLSLKNPAHIDGAYLDQIAQANPELCAKHARNAGSNLSLQEAFEDSETWARDIVVDLVKANGHDGMVIQKDLMPVEHLGGDWDTRTSYVAFSPDQISPVVAPAWVQDLQDAVTRAQAGFYFEEGGCWGMALALQEAMGGELVTRQDFVHAYVLHGAQLYDHQGAAQAIDLITTVSKEKFIALAASHGVDADQVESDRVWAASIVGDAVALANERLSVSTKAVKPDIRFSVSEVATEPEDLLTFYEDIPNERWLADKVAAVVEDGLNQWGVPRFMGSITGRFSRLLNLPVALLVAVPGERGEQNAIRQESLDYIRAHWDAQIADHKPYIEVDPFGKAWVNEGNHRIMVASERGLTHLPVEVRYFSGGQRRAEDFAPARLMQLDAEYTKGNLLQSLVESLPEPLEGEALARVERLPSLRNSAGAAYTFWKLASAALEAVDGDGAKVDWRAVDVATMQESICTNGQSQASVCAALCLHSPGAVSEAQQAELIERVSRIDIAVDQTKYGHSGPKFGQA